MKIRTEIDQIVPSFGLYKTVSLSFDNITNGEGKKKKNSFVLLRLVLFIKTKSEMGKGTKVRFVMGPLFVFIYCSVS